MQISVRVFVTTTDKDGNPTDSDLSKIKVTVTETNGNWLPIVRLNRLSKEEISKFTNNVIPELTDRSDIAQDRKTETTNITEKVAVVQRIHVTRARTKGISDKSTNGNNESIVKLKRKSDLEVVTFTNPKKQKIAKEKGLPPTIEMVNQENENIRNDFVAVLEFSVNEVVWGKIRGWPHWPARITTIEGKKFEVQWFNDYRKSKLFRTQLYKFVDNFKEFSKLFPQKIGLECAAKEACIYLAGKAPNLDEK